MSGLEHWLSGHDSMSSAFMLLLGAAGFVTALVVAMAVLAFRDFVVRETIDTLLRIAVVLIVAALVWTWLDYSVLRERIAERRALDARASELTARAIMPGSALACLNGIENEAVETACEQALFANPQTVAAAVAYVEARLALLADGLEYANRDRGYAAELERPRKVLEADRYGIVAYVMASRGCNGDDCATFKLLSDVSKIKMNLKYRAFEVRVAARAGDWSSNAPTASAPAPSPMASGAPLVAPSNSQVSSAAGMSPASKLNLPMPGTIPQVNIMTPEQTGSVAPNRPEGSNTAPPPDRPAPPRRQSSASKPPAPAKPLPPPPRAPGQAPTTNPQQ